MSILRWVHTCNVTAYHNAISLQVTDTIWSYKLNFHPVPHGVTVFCKRYTMGFPVCYGSPSDVFAASSGYVHLCTLRFKGKEKRADGGDVSHCTTTVHYTVAGISMVSIKNFWKNTSYVLCFLCYRTSVMLRRTRHAMYIKHNIEEHTCNHCCHRKEISITYSECVSEALVAQHEMCMPYITSLFTILSHIS